MTGRGHPRVLAWDGYHNVRDLGGLPLEGGGTTTMARLVRGPRRELMTAAGWLQLWDHGVRTVVDLRNPDEVGRRGSDPAAPPAELEQRVVVVPAPTEDQSDEEFMATCGPILDRPSYYAHNLRLLPGLVAGALTAIARADGGVLFHCSAGRDRTGMVTALLLANAGVPAGAIADDYELSVRAMAATPALPNTEDHQLGLAGDALEAWLAELRPELLAFVDQDVPALLVEIGVDPADVEALRARLVST